MTNVLSGYELETPLPLRIVLCRNRVKGTTVKVYSVSGYRFLLLDASKGGARLPEIGYSNRFDGNVFESEYIRIEGVQTGDLKVTIKKGQPIWAEWSGENTAENLNGITYVRVNEKWYREKEAPVQSDTREPEAA